MKHLAKRSLALLMVLMMLISLMSGLTLTAAAAEQSIVDYQTAYVSDTYPSVIKNWGTRGELATFLSPNAEAFYAETSLEALAAKAGSSDTAAVHTSELYAELQKLMAGAHTKTTSYDATRDMYQYTDIQKNGTETTQISAFYSGTLVGPAWDLGQTWNREHTWPDSKGDSTSGSNENDIMMLRPEAGNINSSRSNAAYGESEGFFDPNLASYNLHGDVARIMLYTFVRWGGVTETAEDGSATYINQNLLDKMWGSDGVIESLDVLLAWMEEDPVDTWEMARNDSVQSITGTRNVFVDYPELAFELFEAEVPAGYDSPSGSANAADFTITASAGEGGEVTVNGEHVTVHPYAGYQVASVAFSDGTTYTQNGNVFTVTSAADCTVTVEFAALDSYTVTVVENGTTVTTATVSDGNIYKLPEFSGELPEGYAFRGWVTYDAGNSATKPSVINAAGAEMVIDDDITYYALLTYLNAEDQSNVALTYELVDSTEDLKIGSSYVITGSETAKALSTTQNSNNRGAADITKSSNVLIFDETAGVAELTLGNGYVPEDTGSTGASESIQYVFGQYDAGTQYAENEVHQLDDVVTVTTSQCHFTSELRIYSSSSHDGYAVISSNVAIKAITLNAGNKADTLNVYGSTDDGATWTLIGGLATATTYQDLTLDMGETSYKLLKLDVAGSSQVRVKNMTLTFAEAVDAGSSDTEEDIPQYSFSTADGYLYAASDSSNWLRTQETLDANASFAITVNSDSTATITAKGTNTRNTIAYNSAQNLFSCYASSNTMEPVALYVGVPGAGTVYYTTTWQTDDWEGEIDPTDAPACTHANTTTTTVDATCVTDGSTTVTCDSCGETISTTVIPATGEHTYENGTCTGCGEAEPTVPASSSATISFATTDQRVSQDSSSTVWQNGDATVTNNKGNSTTNVASYYNPVRFYKSSELVIAYPGMTKIAVTCDTASYATALANSAYQDGASVSVDSKVVTITFAEAVDSTTIVLSAQVRIDEITVYASSCTHEWGGWVEGSAPSCTETGVNSRTCTLCGEVQNQTVAAIGHSYIYGETAIGCANCDYSQAYTLSTIAEAKAYTSTSQVYYIKGIVTYVSGKNVYMEDATGAICVYFATADAASGIAVGDEILVWDTITTYNKLIETTNTTAQEYVKASTGNTLPAQTVTIADILADTANEYLGERVVIENVTIGTINTSGNTALTDADGNTINIYRVSGLSEDINENDTVTVTAIVSTYNGYQLLVNPGTATTDVVETVSGEETVVTTVTIAEAKAGTAGEYYQVEGVVTYISGNSVYVQDETGAIVVYLTASAANTSVGDKIKAYGALKNYNGLLELDGVDETNTEFYEVLSNGHTVEAQAVSIADLKADTTNEYLAEKISLKDVYVSYYSYGTSYGVPYVTYTLTDGNGNTIKIYRVTVENEEECIAGGSIVTVEAVVSSYNGYQLVTSKDKITVTGTCAHETTETVNASAATVAATGYTGDTKCTVCENYVARGETIPCLVDVEAWNLTLGSDLSVNFLLDIDDSVKTTAQVVIAVGETSVTYPVKDSADCIFSVHVAAAQMNDTITVQVVNGEDQSTAKTYTVLQYAEAVLANTDMSAYHPMVEAMLQYGASAQTFFTYNTENLVNANHTDAVTNELPASDSYSVAQTGAVEGLSFYGASMVHKNKIGVRYYFDVTGDASSYTFKVGETAYEPVVKTNDDGTVQCYVEVGNISIADLDEAVTLTITDASGEASVTYGPMYYITRQYNKTTNDSLKALLQQLYDYYMAAESYLTANAQ